MDDGVGAGQAGVDVPGVGEIGGEVADAGMVAAAQVEPGHLVPAAGEIGHDRGADAAGAAGDGDSHGTVPGARLIRRLWSWAGKHECP